MRIAVALALTLVAACKDKAAAPPSSPPVPVPTPQPQPQPPISDDPPDPNAPPTDLAKGTNQFALALWAKLPAGNLAMSPASIAIPLAVMWGGAKTSTATQIGQLLHLPGGPSDIVLSRWGNLAKAVFGDPDHDNRAPRFQLVAANRLYAEKTYEVDTTYFTIARHAFDVWIEPVDFINAADEVRQKINTWVAGQTYDHIKDLMPPRSIGPATKLVVVNAIFFVGDWATPFDPTLTQPREFWVNGATKAQVPTMAARRTFSYASANGASLIELPYKGGSMAMYVIVPDARDGLAAVERSFEPTLKALQAKLADQQVALTLPKFTIDPAEPLELSKALQALGMTDAFDPRAADFSGLATPKDPRDKLFVSTVIHKAFVKVDEKGTEASAATALGAPDGGPPPSATELHVDRPFAFAIVDKTTGLIVFLGRVVDPK